MKLKGKAKKHYYNMLSIIFATLALSLSLLNNFVGIPTGFGMVVDLSAVPIFLSLFLISYKHAVKTLSLFTLALIFLSPSGFIGAIMKFTATIPLIFIPYIFSYRTKNAVFLMVILLLMLIISFGIFSHVYIINELISSIFLFAFSSFLVIFIDKKKFLHSNYSYFSFFIAVVVRGIIMVVTNIYFAGPLFFKLSPNEIISFVESIGIPFIGKTSIFYVIFFWNAVQSIIEVFVAYVVATSKVIKKHL